MKRLALITLGTLITFVVMWYAAATDAVFEGYIMDMSYMLDLTDQGIVTFMLVLGAVFSCVVYTIEEILEEILEEMMFEVYKLIIKIVNKIKVSKKAAAK